ncbi:MAG: Hsp20/alpha crystallin family protein [Propionibacteriaceae bacterium]|jgi:HSP20 family protein|nr:Hsp20/alpha crystallin family protein [Propionibacteriaceae bacterium]
MSSYTAVNPFREMDRLFNQVSRTAASDSLLMPMDLYRKGDAFTVKIDLPGVDPSSIDIDVDDRTLTVRAVRAAETVDTDEEKNGWVSRERSYGTYARQISLGRGLDTSRIEAGYTDGVLTLTIPIAEEAKPRKITVNTTASTTNPVIDQTPDQGSQA